MVDPNRVLFEEQRRDSARHRRCHHRSGAVSHHSDNQIRRPVRHDPPCVQSAERQERNAARDRHGRPPFQSRAAQQIQLEPFLRDYPGLDTSGRACERDARVRLAAQQLPGDRYPRIEMPAGSSSGNHDPQGPHASGAGSVVVTTCVDEAC